MTRRTRYQGAIIDDHHLLLIRHQQHSTGESYWVVPGGGREPGETAEACIQREMMEETNLHVRVVRLLLDEPARPDGVYQWRKTYLCEPVLGKASPGYEPEPEAAADYEIAEVRWFNLRDRGAWSQAMVEDPITYPQVQRIQKELGYLD